METFTTAAVGELAKAGGIEGGAGRARGKSWREGGFLFCPLAVRSCCLVDMQPRSVVQLSRNLNPKYKANT